MNSPTLNSALNINIGVVSNKLGLSKQLNPHVKHCVIVTSFDKNQPGYLDFSYRIQALNDYYHLTIISHQPLKQAELQFSNAKYIVLNQSHGKLGLLSYCWQAARYIKKNQPSITVLMHSSLAFIPLMLKKQICALYWNEHPTNLMHLPEHFSPIKYTVTRVLQKLLFLGAKKAQLVMPIGEEHHHELLEKGCNPQRVEMIYMGVADAFEQNEAPKAHHQDWLKIVYVGTVSVQRGRDVMLDAMANIAQDNIPVHLTIIGANTAELNYCNNRIKHLGIQAHVDVKGRVTGDQIPDLLAQADVGICLWEDKPWWRFNPPTKLFEYLAAGLPVLASDICTHTRYVQHWHNGLIFDYSVEGLTTALADLALNENRILPLKQQAANDGQQYLWRHIEPQFLQKIADLVQV